MDYKYNGEFKYTSKPIVGIGMIDRDYNGIMSTDISKLIIGAYAIGIDYNGIMHSNIPKSNINKYRSLSAMGGCVSFGYKYSPFFINC